MIILHNPNSKESVAFVDAHGDGNTVIDWYNVDYKIRAAYLIKYPAPTSFPFLVHEKTGFAAALSDIQEYDGTLLEYVKSLVSARMRAICEGKITSGFTHSALGAPYFYPTTIQDQINLIMNALAAKTIGDSVGPFSFWCMDADQIWDLRDHTAAQISQVWLGMAANTRSIQNVFKTKLDAVLSAQTVAEVLAIVWE